MTRTRYVSLAAGASLAAMTVSAAHAQTAPAATELASAEPQTGLGDIIVTGEKHETKLQTAPLAITAVSGAALQERNINELADINGYVPGLTITKSEGAERIVAIRGIGYETAQNPNTQPGVAFHIDGVYIAHVIALNQDLLDVDHIEVLRGPQGTVFGQTSTGGAINVITKKPILGKWEGEAQASYGNYNYAKFSGALNVPISETLAFRGAIQYLRHDGYGEATAVPGKSHYGLDDANNLGAHGALLWQPSDTFSAMLSGQTFDSHHHAYEQKCVLCENYDGDVFNTATGSINYVTDPNSDPRKVYQDYPGKFRTSDRLINLTLTQRLGDVATLKSVTAYQYLNKHQSGDNDRYAYSTYFDNLVFWQDHSKTWTQEVSIQSINNDKFEYTVGGFFLHQNAFQNILELSANGFLPNPADPTGPLVSFQTDSPFTHTTYAGYGQGIWHATDKLSLTAGLRYSSDKITGDSDQYFGAFGIAHKQIKSRALTGKVSLEYRVTPDNMVYVTGSKGYKPAGLNFNTTPVLVGQDLQKETVWAAEIGSKNDFFDKKLRLNVSGFYYWYKNFQYTAEDPVPNQGGTTNIPRAHVYGIELEGSAIPTPALRFDGNISFERGKFDSNYKALNEQVANYYRALAASEGIAYTYGAVPSLDQAYFSVVEQGLQNIKGHDLPRLPHIQGSLSATYTADFGDRGKARLRGEVLYRGHFNSNAFETSVYNSVPSYTIFNLFVEYKPNNSHFTFSVSAANVTNKAGVSNKFADPYGSATVSEEFIDPRQVFGTIAYKF